MGVIGTRLEMSWITAASGILIGPPIAGALVDLNTDYFFNAIVFAGVVIVPRVACLMPPSLAAVQYKPVEN
ncbi:putative mfs monocarboxylate protein [Botrytis cinerea BcDW1]|uniref:Putative mfs monocarboxylate protein n=1 Tax=Botryotinia fuckeliana (strain BcDW1) TaxID=1290391 RepID=M7TG28_BOTF1|nr:putative mfs monocarboxylate protein [Botrytis cinerea BcDW1]